MLDDGRCEEFSYPAVFWLPSKPFDKRAGLLEFEPGKTPKAVIDQGWSEPERSSTEARMPVRRDHVWGATIGSKAITFSLLNVRDYQASSGFQPGYSHRNRQLLASILVGQGHVKDLDSVISVYGKHSGLLAALSIEGFNRKQWFENAPEGPGTDLLYRTPKNQTAKLDHDTAIKIGFGYSNAGKAEIEPDGYKRSITVSPEVAVNHDKPTSYQKLWETYLTPLDGLIRFASNSDGRWISISAVIEGHGRPVNIFRKEIASIHRYPTPDGRPDINFHLNHLSDWHFPRVIKTWMKIYSRYQHSLLSGFQALGEDNIAEKGRLYAVALEGLSSYWADDIKNRLAEEKWKDLKKSFRQLVKDHDLDPELMGRFRDMIDRPTLVEKLVAVSSAVEGSTVDKPEEYNEDLFKILKDVRNGFSHSRENQEPPTLEEIRIASYYGERLFRATCLTMLPIKKENREAIIQRILSGENQ